jgi:hypothetical protein
MENDQKEVVMEQAAAGANVVITGSLDITLADGTVDKRPFRSVRPLAEFVEKSNG